MIYGVKSLHTSLRSFQGSSADCRKKLLSFIWTTIKFDIDDNLNHSALMIMALAHKNPVPFSHPSKKSRLSVM
jgi:hypothetical protein